MKRVILTALVAIAAAGVSTSMIGCGAAMGTTVVKHNSGSEPIETTAPADGVYDLTYTFSGAPTVSVTLKKGDRIGFAKAGDKVVAVAADKTYPVDTNIAAAAHWKGPKK
jgi:hypothetical protein